MLSTVCLPCVCPAGVVAVLDDSALLDSDGLQRILECLSDLKANMPKNTVCRAYITPGQRELHADRLQPHLAETNCMLKVLPSAWCAVSPASSLPEVVQIAQRVSRLAGACRAMEGHATCRYIKVPSTLPVALG